jgi:anaerobic dimethyl sulfoxide reductase subunit A
LVLFSTGNDHLESEVYMDALYARETTNKLNRRQFLVGCMTVAASATALSAIGCTPQAELAEDKDIEHVLPTNDEAAGTWIPAACWHNCGGRCVNKVMVKDGVVIRQKTDDSHEDSPEYPQQRGCVRGKTQQQQCFGVDRLLYPLKRKGWAPGGGAAANGQMRGKDEWERISWDEAIKLASDEIKRIKDAYGNAAFYSKSAVSFMNGIGGILTSWETQSMGTYSFDVNLLGLPSRDLGNANDRFDMLNADLIVMYASNPTWSAAGTPINYWINARDAGCKFISVDPLYNASAHMLDAEWVPVRTGTDMAFLLGVAYEMLRLDKEEGGIIDWDFLNKYTVGFDAEHMPQDATINENFQGYVMGDYDGTPKTPQWAEAICGTPAAQITSFARAIGKKDNVMLLHNMAASRNHGADQLPQLFMTIGCMGGHIGKPGNACGSCYHADAGNAGPKLVTAGSATPSKAKNEVVYHPRTNDILEIIAGGNGGTFSDVGGYGNTFHDPEMITLGPVKCIIHQSDASLQTSPNQKKNIEAHRTVDFVLSFATFMTTHARYSDIVFPVNTEWERVGSLSAANRETLIVATRVTESLGESKSDQEIGELMLKALGADPSVVFPVSEEQAFYEKLAGAKVVGKSGEMENLITLTADDIAQLGAQGEPQQGIINCKEFLTTGSYQVQRTANDGLGSIGYSSFIEDPDANPLKSASGKFEIYCQAQYNLMQSLNYPNHEAYKPYATYVDPPEHVGYINTFKDRRIGGTKGDYPYLLYNPHYLRRSHTVFDNCPWLREAWPNPIFISRSDAAEKGISEGDTVLITTYVGKILRRAALLDNLIPGVVGVPHGAWIDVDESTGIDRAGSDNYLIGNEYSGFGVTGYNDCNCNIEKYSGTPLMQDSELPPRYVSDMA